MDVRFLIDVLAVGLDGAQGASRLLRVLARRHAGGKGAADIALRVGKLGVAAEEQLVHQGVHFLFAEVRQTADLRLGGVQIVLRRRHLTAQALLLRLQRGDRPFVGAQLVGEGEQLLENGLLLGVVRRGDAVNARQNGAEVAVGVKDAAGDAYREEEHQQEKKLHGAASHGGVVVALGQEHRQRVGRIVPGGEGEGRRQTDEAAVGAGKGGERAGGFGGELLRRDEAEAAGGVRQQAAGDVQRAAGVGGEDARQMLNAGGLGVVGGEIGLVHGEAAETVDRAVRAEKGDGQENGLLGGAGQGEKHRGAAGGLERGGGAFQMVGEAGEVGECELLRPLAVGHYAVEASHIRHAPVEQQVTDGVLGIAALDENAAVGVRAAGEGGVQQDERTGAVRLPRILAERLQHRLLQRLDGVHAAVEGGEAGGLLLDQSGHVLGEMDAHGGDAAPEGVHVRAERLQLEGQGAVGLLAGAFQLTQQEQTRQQCRQEQRGQRTHVAQQPVTHGGVGTFQFGKQKFGHGRYLPLSGNWSVDGAEKLPSLLRQRVHVLAGGGAGGQGGLQLAEGGV